MGANRAIHSAKRPRRCRLELTFRPATGADAAALAEVFGSEPSEEQLGMAGGDARRAARFRRATLSSITGAAALSRTTVAVRDGRVVGLLQTGAEAGDAITPQLVWGILRAFGPGVFAFLKRDRSRARVHIRPPDGAFHIAEVHVLASLRGAGIGGALMDEAERQARAGGARAMSLTTSTSNPARHLYERHGFRVVQERTDATFERITGVAGRVLMVKELR